MANIILENTYDGTSADGEGNFVFTTEETGAQTLVVKVMGFKDYRHALTLDGKSVTLAVQLEEAIKRAGGGNHICRSFYRQRRNTPHSIQSDRHRYDSGRYRRYCRRIEHVARNPESGRERPPVRARR